MGRRCAWCAASSGASADRSKGWPPTRDTSTCSCRRAQRKRLAVERSRHAFAYVFAGAGTFRDASDPRPVKNEIGPSDVGNRSLVLFDRGDEITVEAGDQGIRFLLISGKPIEEPVAWYGPIVMNTKAELQQAMSDLRDGTFIK